MTEAIIITAIIVAGIVGLAWVLLHFGYKAWLRGLEEGGLAEAPELNPNWPDSRPTR